MQRFDFLKYRQLQHCLQTLAVRSLGILAFALGAANIVFADDYVVIVGNDKYPGLKSGADLAGCENDANMFKGTINTYGVKGKYTVLINQQATKQNILAAINALRDKVKSGDRVILYFAMHGVRELDGRSAILPYNAMENDPKNDITVDELYDAVKALSNADCTVIADTCFSGGLVKGDRATRSFSNHRARFYVRSSDLDKSAKFSTGRDVKRWNEGEINGNDENVEKFKKGGIVYYAATQKLQVSNEDVIGGEPHGFFTYYLCQALGGGMNLWRDVSSSVASKVSDATEQTQSPLLSPASCLEQVVFGSQGGPSPDPNPEPFDMEKMYSISNPDPSALVLKRFPEYSPIQMSQGNYFEIKVQRDGYLLLLNRDPNQQLSVVFPRSVSGDSTGKTRGWKEQYTFGMQVKAGDVIRVPNSTSKRMFPDTPGVDGLKALLFTDADAGFAMLQPFVSTVGKLQDLSIDSARSAWKARAWHEDDIAKSIYTSEVITKIIR